MRTIQTEYVSPCVDHCWKHFVAPRRRPQTCHNFRPTPGVIHLLGLVPLFHVEIIIDLWREQVLGGLCLQNCRGLSHDRLDWVLSACCLAAQHHRIRAVPNSVLQIADLRSGGHRCLDHAFHHLRRSDDKETCIFRPYDQKFLCKRNALHTQLDAKISPRHHQRLRLGDDAIDVGQSLRLLNLGADLGPLVLWNAKTVHDVDQLLEVLTFLDERDAYVLAGRVQLQ
mmetsp:Transcript_32173/g.86169  ORF Transcript_32173/g.86169 Transcript_32173/m.86169 type:complete len:226 (-) Transcript_32173:1661-2338(-)